MIAHETHRYRTLGIDERLPSYTEEKTGSQSNHTITNRIAFKFASGSLKKIIIIFHQTFHRFQITCDIPCVRAIPPWLKSWVVCESDWVKIEEFPLLAALPTRGPFP